MEVTRIMKNDINQDDDEGGSDGKQGNIEFRFVDERLKPTRDDLLPPNEIKRLHNVLKDVHKGHVDKQKRTRDERKTLKNGKYVAPQQGRSLGGGGSASHRHSNHPLLSKKAQFDGIDKQVVGIPALNEADTNPDLKAELENRLENRLQNRLQNTPQFNPRPRFPG